MIHYKDKKAGFIIKSILGVLLAANIIGLFAGIITKDNYYSKVCEEPVKRFEVVIPTFRLGCWFGGNL